MVSSAARSPAAARSASARRRLGTVGRRVGHGSYPLLSVVATSDAAEPAPRLRSQSSGGTSATNFSWSRRPATGTASGPRPHSALKDAASSSIRRRNGGRKTLITGRSGSTRAGPVGLDIRERTGDGLLDRPPVRLREPPDASRSTPRRRRARSPSRCPRNTPSELLPGLISRGAILQGRPTRSCCSTWRAVSASTDAWERKGRGHPARHPRWPTCRSVERPLSLLVSHPTSVPAANQDRATGAVRELLQTGRPTPGLEPGTSTCPCPDTAHCQAGLAVSGVGTRARDQGSPVRVRASALPVCRSSGIPRPR